MLSSTRHILLKSLENPPYFAILDPYVQQIGLNYKKKPEKNNKLLPLEVIVYIPFLIFQYAKDLLNQLELKYYEKCDSQ